MNQPSHMEALELPPDLQVPAERTPPASLRARTMHAIVTPSPVTTSRHGWLRPLTAAAAAGGVLVGGTVLAHSGFDPSSERGLYAPTDRPSQTAAPHQETPPRAVAETVQLDLGPASAAQAATVTARCAAQAGFDPQTADVLYARRVDGLAFTTGPQVVVAVRASSGDVWACSSSTGFSLIGGPSGKSGSMVSPSSPRDIATTDYGGYQWADDPNRGFYWDFNALLVVGRDVARVDTRATSPNDLGVWRVAQAHGGFVYAAAWFDHGRYDPSAGDVQVEYRAYDRSGDPIHDLDLAPMTLDLPDDTPGQPGVQPGE